MRLVAAVVVCVGLFSVLFPVRVDSLVQDIVNIEVSVGVNDTIMTVQGQTSPGAIVTVLLDGSVVGTARADASTGKFSKQFPAQKKGLHSLSIYARDRDGNTTDTITQTINLRPQAETTIDFFLPPSIYMSHLQISRGETISFWGITAPNSNVVVSIDNNSTFTTKAGSTGRWRLEFDTSDLNGPVHTVRALGIDQDGRQSTISALRRFTLYFPDGRPFDAAPSDLRAPIILSPQMGAVIPDPTTVVSGTAQPNLQLELYDGERLIGSIFTDSRGEWRIEIGVTEMKYELRARVCAAARCSDYSETISVSNGNGNKLSGFSLLLDRYRFFNYGVNEIVTAQITFVEGSPPFSIQIDWGDGVVERLSANSRDSLTISHRYREPGNYNGNVAGIDKNNAADIHYFAVEIRNEPSQDNNWLILLIGLVAVGASVAAWWYSYRTKKMVAGSQRRSDLDNNQVGASEKIRHL